jgi:hypothetical protein
MYVFLVGVLTQWAPIRVTRVVAVSDLSSWKVAMAQFIEVAMAVAVNTGCKPVGFPINERGEVG